MALHAVQQIEQTSQQHSGMPEIVQVSLSALFFLLYPVIPQDCTKASEPTQQCTIQMSEVE